MTKRSLTTTNSEEGTFVDHLDVLRTVIIRSLLAVIAFAIVAFAFKDELFDIVLAPHSSDFFIFRHVLHGDPFDVQLVNIELTEQFMAHIKVAFYAGVLLASPYVLYLLFGFISPALYKNEHKYATIVVTSAYVMFVVGTLLNYCLIFPLTVRFLGTYSVSTDVHNMLSLQSYIDTLLIMCLMLGIIFELPVVAWVLGKLKLINSHLMAKFRRHAVVVILIVAAIITPTTDAFTLLVVSLPIWILYEGSILLVRATQPKSNNQEQ